MDWKAFIASIVGSIAWPSVWITLIIVLRRQLVGLAESLQELTLPGGAKAIFKSQLEVARIEAESLPSVAGEPSADRIVPELEGDKFLRLATRAPEAAIAESYQRIEDILREMASLLGIELPAADADVVIAKLIEVNMIDQAAADLYRTLRRIRNIAVHAQPSRISTKEALDYREHTTRLVNGLSFALGQLRARREINSNKSGA